MSQAASIGTPSNGNRRRQSLSQLGVRVIFSCIKDNKPPPDHITFRIIVVPKCGTNNGLKLSPPPYEYEDGVYVLLRLHVTVPSILSDRVLLHRDLALIPECPWSLSGPQNSGESIDLQQRYCTPKGNGTEYCNHTKGAIWTMVDSDGKEDFDCRVFNVYHSNKRSTCNDRPKGTRPHLSPMPKQSSPKAPMPDSYTQKSNVKAHALFNDATGPEEASSPSDDDSSSIPANVKDTDNGAIETNSKKKRQKQSPIESKKSVTATGKARQTTRTWTTKEDIKLTKLVEQCHDVAGIAWNVLAVQMENRSGKQCRERYVYHLTPYRKKGKWTETEDSHIIRLQSTLGNQWSKIAADLLGRSDNDVKNRWHSRMRSEKRKHDKVGKNKLGKGKRRCKVTDVQKDDPSRQDSVIDSKIDLIREETPKVGQRVQVEVDGGKMHEGTITNISLILNSTLKHRYNVMIHFDNGTSEVAALPDETIHLVPTNNQLSENEVKLCHELINLHNALKEPSGAGRSTRKQVSGEESHDSSEHDISADSKAGSGTLNGSGNDVCETSVEGSTTTAEGLDRKHAADPNEDKDSAKPSPQASKSVMSTTSRGRASSSAEVAQGPRTSEMSHSSCPSTAIKFQAQNTLFQRAPAPFLALPNQQQQQLLAAAQLLSSVNPGLAVAAISQARYIHDLGLASRQAQTPGLFFPQQILPLNTGLPTNLSQPPVSILSVPMQAKDQDGELVNAGLSGVPCPTSKAEGNIDF